MKCSYRWKVLFIVALGTFLAALDGSIIAIAFPELTRVFNTGLTEIMWVILIYMLVSSCLMLTFGKMSDSIGRKIVFVSGLGIFTVAMAACGMARSLEQMLVFRALQAIGAAMAIGCGTALVTEAFPREDLGKALGTLGIAVSVAFIIGPVSGGLLLHWLGWRAIFYVRIPVSLMAFALSILFLKKDLYQTKRMHLDVFGTVIFITGLCSLLYGMGQIKAHGVMSPTVLVWSSAGLLILFLFPLVERRAKEPLLDFHLFRNRNFTYPMVGLFLFFLTTSLYVAILPFYLIDGIRLSSRDSGLLLSVIPAATLIVSPISGALSDRFGPRWPSLAGAGAIAGAFLCMFWFDLRTEIFVIASVLILLGMGTGAFQPPNNSMIMASVEPKFLGSASALLATSRQVGISVGLALTGTVFATRQSAYHDAFRDKGLDAAEAVRHSIPLALSDLIPPFVFLALAVLVLSLLTSQKQYTSKRGSGKIST